MKTKKLSRVLVGTSLLMIFALALPLTGICAPAAPPYNEELVVLSESLTGEDALPNLGNAASLSLWGSMSEYLIYRDRKTYKPDVPGLAESWDISDDFTTYTFHLHKGIQFHNGWGELTAEDVKFTFEVATRKDSLNTRATWLRESVANIVIKDPYTIAFTLKEPSWQFLDNCTNFMPILPIVCKKYVEKVGIKEANLKPIGTGPYRLVDRRLGEFIKFEAVPNHWRKTPDFKYVTIKAVPEVSTQIAMLRAKEADIIPITADKAPVVEKAGFRTILNPGARLYWVVLGSMAIPKDPEFKPRPWWADPADKKAWEKALKVRKALNLAVNKQEIIDTLFLGKATPYGCAFFWPEQPGWDPAWKPYPYDPKQAKQLLAEAGYPNGFEVTMLLLKHSGRPEAPDLGEAVAMYWEQVGIRVKRVPMDFATLRPQMYARKVDACWIYGMPYYSEPIIDIQSELPVGDQPYPRVYLTGVDNEVLWGLARAAFAELDFDKRCKLIRKWGQYYYDNYFSVPLCGKGKIWALSDRVGERPVVIGMGFDGQLFEYITYKK